MTVFAYMRVSTDDQTTNNQKKMIMDIGYNIDNNNWYSEEGVSGSIKALDRPQFYALMQKAKQGDTVVVTMIDRLGRDAEDILHTINQFKKLGIRLCVLQFDGVDVTSTMGKMIVTVFAAVAEMERNLIIERTNAGLARTKAKGTKLGAPLKIQPEVMKKAIQMKEYGKSYVSIAKECNVPASTLSSSLKQWLHKGVEAYEREFNTRKQQYALVV